ncbi:rhomboid family intramembrane serine protease [Opitutaceae bacterium TAV4]|uniref:rhomboid family protein n=1 Tax=Geminisphaera colitermitum TaxID=1148786 RepID=UPI0001964F28|nr:rhomboid family intramembrane serine protease [Geminisphaera colitermitum]RRJ96093.1 rhomboid family intramembrane serine protease [Opitutaceae bacterium TAV4]RRK01745.1 rhomboid family intramembrane serine protease [Opitutaceae bacterium TAV3]
MLYDRPYMRDTNPQRSSLPVFGWVIAVIVAVFVLQEIAVKLFRSNLINDFAELDIFSLKHGRVWTLLTYALLHASLFHIFANSIALFFTGRILEPILGPRRILWLLGASILGGSLLWVAVNFNHRAPLVGISAGAMGWFTVFCLLFWDRPINLLLFFVIPITIKPRWLLYIGGGIEVFGMVFGEILQRNTFYGSGVAHSAHVGGIIAGWLYYRFVLHSGGKERDARPEIEKPGWFKRATNSAAPKPVYKVNVSSQPASSPADIRAEVDRILDKINSHGFASLSDEEKRTLDEARDVISRR